MTIYEEARYQAGWHKDNGHGATDLIEAAIAAGEAAEAKLAEAESREKAMREALLRVEWCIQALDGGPSCPICAHAMYAGHNRTCSIGAALAAGKEP